MLWNRKNFSHASYVLVLFCDDRSEIPVLMAFRTKILVFQTNLVKAITIPSFLFPTQKSRSFGQC